MKRMHLMFIAIAILFLSFVTVLAHSGLGGSHDLSWHTIDGGGGVSIAGDLQLAGTIAQPDTAVMSSCTADLNRDGVVNSIDLTLLLTCLGQPADACDHDCDVNGDGQCDMVDVELMLAQFNELCIAMAGGFWQFSPTATR